MTVSKTRLASSIVGKLVGNETGLIQSVGVRQDLLCEGDHVVNIETPLALALPHHIRHGWPLV